jgi:SLOG family YspA-like protein
MRVLVCGGRDFSDTDWAYRILDELHRNNNIDVIIEGDARGADRIAGYWAGKNRIDNLKFRADWDRYGKAAGSIRNTKMLKESKPDLVLAFPGGRGTANMISQAKLADIPVLIELKP